MRANRTWLSPPGPNPTPGEVATSASSHQELGELQRAHLPVGLGDRRPHEHGAPGRGDLPPDAVEPVAQGVPSGLVGLVDQLGVVGRFVHGHDGGDLDGLEGPVVEIALELGQGLHDGGVADQEPHPPAGHGERLGQGVELDGHVLGPRHLQDGGRGVPVEGDVGVGEVVDQDDLVLLGELHQTGHPCQVDALGGRVVREGEDHHPGLGPCRLPRLHEVVEEGLAGTASVLRPGGVQADVAHVGAGEEGCVDVDGIGRRRHECGVARPHQHPHQVGQAFFGADRGDHFGVGVQLHLELAQIEIGDGLTDLGDPTAGRVAVVARVPSGLGQLLHGHVR